MVARGRNDWGAPYAHAVSDADRERDLRRLERDRRRREEGRAAYFDRSESLDRWPLLADMSEQPTMALPVPPPRQEGGSSAAPRRVGAIFAVATGMSRVLGLVREVIASYYFGATGKINAFTVAFQLPNLVRALVADAALSSAFVPVFSELLEKGERKRAWRVASTPVLADAARADRADGGLHPRRAVDHRPLRQSRSRSSALAVGLSRVLFPIVDAARRVGDRRRDPQ